MNKFEDSRGYLITLRTGLFTPVASLDVWSASNVIRGLHIQLNKPQAKLIRVMQGDIVDCAVDVRPNSATYKDFFFLPMSAKEPIQLYLPAGFLHGYWTAGGAHISYECDQPYDAESERIVVWNDKTIGIPWTTSFPLAFPKMSLKDEKAKSFEEQEEEIGKYLLRFNSCALLS